VSWNSEHTEADQNEECQPNVSAKCSHVWSLWIIALIVQRFGNLWMPLVGRPSVVDNRSRSSSGSIPKTCVTCDARIDSARQTCHQV
jgi:hypothetical protein